MTTVTVHWVNTERFGKTEEALSLLSDEERAQHDRFIPLGKKHEFLVARWLSKTVLGELLGHAPEFTKNEWGCPSLKGESKLRFNITHTDGLVAMIVSDQFDVGCDAELLSRAPKLLALGPNVFAPKELAELNALPTDQQPLRAVTLWTLKESYIKARGMGLALPLDGFAFRIDAENTGVEIEPRLNDDGAQWQFTTTTLGPHLISTAIRSTSDVKLELREAHFTEQ
jgi:4'-phosphopantetheinyl transferase